MQTIIHVGSQNKPKLDAVNKTVALYPNLFPNPDVRGVDVRVALHGHPKTLDQTIAGARERATQAFYDCRYSIGIEGGLMAVPHSTTGYMEVSVCAISDGTRIVIGISSGFEWPKKVTELIRRGTADASKAFKDLALTHHEKLGAMEGGITGFLTHGRVTREDTIVQSLVMALMQFERPEWY